MGGVFIPVLCSFTPALPAGYIAATSVLVLRPKVWPYASLDIFAKVGTNLQSLTGAFGKVL